MHSVVITAQGVFFRLATGDGLWCPGVSGPEVSVLGCHLPRRVNEHRPGCTSHRQTTANTATRLSPSYAVRQDSQRAILLSSPAVWSRCLVPPSLHATPEEIQPEMEGSLRSKLRSRQAREQTREQTMAEDRRTMALLGATMGHGSNRGSTLPRSLTQPFSVIGRP